jgi:PKD repeat protein
MQGDNQNDTGSDGYFDEPFVIDSNNKDNYPYISDDCQPVISAPMNLKFKTGVSFIKLTWEPPSIVGEYPVKKYIIYRNTNPNEEKFLFDVGVRFYYNDSDVSNGVTYYYSVRTKSEKTDGLVTNEYSAIPGLKPSTPLDISSVSGDSFVKLNWSEPASTGGLAIMKYRIYKQNIETGDQEVIDTENVIFYNDTKVINGVKYNYSISAINSIGEGLRSGTITGFPQLRINKIPIVSGIADKSNGAPPLMVSFTGSWEDKDGSIISFEWDFGDNTKSYEPNPVHTFTGLGTYEVILTVTDNDYAQNSTVILITITDIIEADIPAEPQIKDEKDVEKSSWQSAAEITTIIGVIVVIGMISLWQMQVRKKRKEETQKKKVKKKEYVRKKMLKKGEVPDKRSKTQTQPQEGMTDEESTFDQLEQKLIMGEISEDEYRQMKDHSKEEKIEQEDEISEKQGNEENI